MPGRGPPRCLRHPAPGQPPGDRADPPGPVRLLRLGPAAGRTARCRLGPAARPPPARARRRPAGRRRRQGGAPPTSPGAMPLRPLTLGDIYEGGVQDHPVQPSATVGLGGAGLRGDHAAADARHRRSGLRRRLHAATRGRRPATRRGQHGQHRGVRGPRPVGCSAGGLQSLGLIFVTGHGRPRATAAGRRPPADASGEAWAATHGKPLAAGRAVADPVLMSFLRSSASRRLSFLVASGGSAPLAVFLVPGHRPSVVSASFVDPGRLPRPVPL